MPIMKCTNPQCGATVIPMADGNCPSCKHFISLSASATRVAESNITSADSRGESLHRTGQIQYGKEEFDVYCRNGNDFVAIKKGFSWPGFIFSWLWAFYKGLWLESILILACSFLAPIVLAYPLAVVVWISYKGGYVLLGDSESLELVATCLALSLIGLMVGFSGNNLLNDKLKRKGYKFCMSCRAMSSDSAILMAQKAKYEN